MCYTLFRVGKVKCYQEVNKKITFALFNSTSGQCKLIPESSFTLYHWLTSSLSVCEQVLVFRLLKSLSPGCSPMGSVVVETECVMHLICICGVSAMVSVALSVFMKAPHASVLPALQNSNALRCLLRFMIRSDTFGPFGTSFQVPSRWWDSVGKLFRATLKIMTSECWQTFIFSTDLLQVLLGT